jgi:hypothetical protein
MRWPKGMNLSGNWFPSSVQLWDVPSLWLLATLNDETIAGWNPDGRLVTASEEPRPSGFVTVGPEH